MLREIYISPFEGDWSLPNYPPEVEILGKRFRLSSWVMPDGHIQYREVASESSMHLRVDPSTRKWRIDHIDLVNPDGPVIFAPVQHFFLDTTVGQIASALIGIVAVAVAVRFIDEKLNAPSIME